MDHGAIVEGRRASSRHASQVVGPDEFVSWPPIASVHAKAPIVGQKLTGSEIVPLRTYCWRVAISSPCPSIVRSRSACLPDPSAGLSALDDLATGTVPIWVTLFGEWLAPDFLRRLGPNHRSSSFHTKTPLLNCENEVGRGLSEGRLTRNITLVDSRASRLASFAPPRSGAHLTIGSSSATYIPSSSALGSVSTFRRVTS